MGRACERGRTFLALALLSSRELGDCGEAFCLFVRARGDLLRRSSACNCYLQQLQAADTGLGEKVQDPAGAPYWGELVSGGTQLARLCLPAVTWGATAACSGGILRRN